VVPTIDEQTQLPVYKAQSPDEVTLPSAILPHAQVTFKTKYAMTLSVGKLDKTYFAQNRVEIA
jgi:hypothetical protein